MKTKMKDTNQSKPAKRPYSAPQLESIQIDTEIALVMDSNNQNQGPPAEFIPGGWAQKIFKFGW